MKRKSGRSARQKMKRDAHKAPGWVRDIASTKFDPAGNRAYRDGRLGSFGPASEVRHIDPAEYLQAKSSDPMGNDRSTVRTDAAIHANSDEAAGQMVPGTVQALNPVEIGEI